MNPIDYCVYGILELLEIYPRHVIDLICKYVVFRLRFDFTIFVLT